MIHVIAFFKRFNVCQIQKIYVYSGFKGDSWANVDIEADARIQLILKSCYSHSETHQTQIKWNSLAFMRICEIELFNEY